MNRFGGNLGGKLGNIGQTIRMQAEELNAKAKEAAKHIEEGLNAPNVNNNNNNNTNVAVDGLDKLQVNKEPNKNKDDEKMLESSNQKEQSLASRDPDSVSKEELLDILQKMNKRVKALSALRATLIERVKVAEGDKNRLLTLMKNEVLSNVDLEDASKRAEAKNAEKASKAVDAEVDPNDSEEAKIDEIAVIQLAWREADERNQMALQQLQSEYKVISLQYQAEIEKVKKDAEDQKQLADQKVTNDASEDQTLNNNVVSNGDATIDTIDKAVKEAVDACNNKHSYEIEQLRKGLQESHELSMQAQREELLHSQEMLLKEAMDKAAEDLERVKVEADERINNALWKAKGVESENENEKLTSMKKEYEATLLQSQDKHDNELQNAIQQISDMSQRMEENERNHAEQMKVVAIEHMEKIKEIETKAANEKAASLGVMKQKVKSKMEEMKEAFNSKISKSLKEESEKHERELNECKQKYAAEIENLKTQNNLSAEETKSSDQTEIIATEIEKVREELKSSHDIALNKLREDVMKERDDIIKAEIEKVQEELKASHDVELNKLREDIMKERDITVKEAMEKAAQDVELARSEADKQMKEALSKATEASTKIEDQKLHELREEFELKLSTAQAAHQEALNAVVLEKESLSATIADLETNHAEAIEALKAQYTDTMEKINNDKEGSKEQYETELIKQRQELEASRESLSDLEKKHNEVIEELKASHDVELNKLREDIMKERDITVKEAMEKAAQDVELARSEADKQMKEALSKATEASTKIEDQKLHELREEFELKLSTAQAAHQEALNAVVLEKESLSATIADLETNHAEAIEALKAQYPDTEEHKQIVLEEAKSAFKAKLEEVRSNYEKDKSESLQSLKSKFIETLKSRTSEHEAAKVKLQEEMNKHNNELKAFFEDKMSTAKKDFETLQSKLESEKLELSQNLAAREKDLSLVKEDECMLQNKLKAQISKELALSQEIERLKAEHDKNNMSSEESKTILINQKENMEKLQKELEVKLESLNKDLASKNNEIEELNGKLSAISQNLNTIAAEKNDLQSKMEVASKKVSKLDAAETELGNAREELNRYRLELSQNKALLERLQAEKDSSEKKHGQRTALVGMLEAQLSDLNENNAELQGKFEAAVYDLSQKDDEVKIIREKLEHAESALKQSQHQNQVLKRSTTEHKSQNVADDDLMKKAKMVDSLQRELQALQQQMSKKSAAAQRLLQEREKDCMELKKRNKILQQELDKGSFSDRKIFELAEKQSNRESLATAEIQMRNELVRHLTEKLENHDTELASAEYSSKQIEGQFEDLCRIHRREDVNLDYLKSTVVQYLSKPPGSSEREALLPVLATLLQFDEEDYKMIAEGKTKVSWFGSVLPTIIGESKVQHR